MNAIGPEPKKKRILFIHHSTGGLLLRWGRVREKLRQAMPAWELWDHGYNLYPVHAYIPFVPWFTFHTGLSDGNGKIMGRDFNIVISNNSPKEYAEIFARDPSDPTLSEILRFDAVLFKNCFPTSNILSDSQLSEYKNYYASIFKSLSAYPNTFVAFTHPPLRREMTTADAAARARKLAGWMKEHANDNGTNINVFDFFDLLADDKGGNINRLKRAYCPIIPFDSHPNPKACGVAGTELSGFLQSVL